MLRIEGISFLILVLTTQIGCGGGQHLTPGSPPGSPPGSSPPPGVNVAISPTSAVAGGPDLTLTITGSKFTFTSAPHKFNEAVWSANGSNTSLATTFISNTQLNAVVPAALLTNAVTAKVHVEVWDRQGDVADAVSDSVSFGVISPFDSPGTPSIGSISPTSAAAGTPDSIRYDVTDLGTLGGTFSGAGGINERGDVSGVSTIAGDKTAHAFQWQAGRFTDLGTLGGPNSWGNVINNSGAVTGYAETSNADPFAENYCFFGTDRACRGFVWQKGFMSPLSTLGGNNSYAVGINNQGQVAGNAETSVPDSTCAAPEVLQYRPVIWTKGEIQELPTLAGDPDGFAEAINDRGQTVGASGTCADPLFHALLWQEGTVTDLGNLGGTDGNVAHGINELSQVVGRAELADNASFHAFLWQGVMTDLGTLPGDFASVAVAINNQGQVVGSSFDIAFNGRAFLWQSGVMFDLNSLIPADSALFLVEPGAINSRGQIVGFAVLKSSGEVHAFLANPSKDRSDEEGAASVGSANAGEKVKFVVPENVRKIFRDRLVRGRPGAQLTKPQ